MLKLKQLWWWYESLWSRPSISEDAAQKLKAAHLLVQQSRSVIISHRFQEHCALCEIAALETWNHEVYPQLQKELHDSKS